MKFDSVDPRQSFPALEQGILKYWREQDMFRRSISERAGAESFSFYDGPPFATGLPHYGHLLAGTIKDVIPRYQTMRGKRVERRFGWDCHGLPIENLIEKEKNIASKRDIEAIGVATFNALCRGSVQRYTKEWRTVVERTGRWVDMDFDYRTMDPSFMESIWWAFSEVHRKKLLYEGHRPIHICPRCATPLSNFEVGQGYKEITDASATAMFRLKETKETQEAKETEEMYMLAWTTTPWTLPGNLFLAVHSEVLYVTVESDGKKFIVAKDLVETVFKDKEHAVTGKAMKGKSLVGKTYEPLFPYFKKKYEKEAFRVVAGDFVTTEDGTGIVHIAPGFGEDDFNVGKKEGVALLQHVTMDGHFTADVTDFADEEVKPAKDPSKTDRAIAEYLKKHGKLFASENYRHSYPHCWRCDTPLLNYATSSWFVAVEKIKDKLLANAKRIAWMPAHLKEGRFGKWLEGARDWSISRNRYWGTPLPIWRSAGGDLEVISGRDDLMAHQRMRYTKMTVLRHAESEGNTIPVYQGNVPGTKLTQRGRTQAAAAAKYLKDTDVAIIYTSPLARTRETAEIIAKATGAQVVVDERLREVSFGDYEGKTIDFSDLAMIAAKRAKKIEDASPESIYHFPGMESWQSVQDRVANFLDEILSKHRSSHVVVVTHADPIMNVRHYVTKQDPVKISHQPFPPYATPESFFWDNDRNAELDLHRENVDDIEWPGSQTKDSVHLTMVRHGETDLNKERIVQGSEKDPPLNAKGQEQAAEIARHLKGKKFDVILSSQLKRAATTADAVAKELGMTVAERNPLFRERDLGEWTGRPIAEVVKQNPLLIDVEKPAMHHLQPPKGESLSQFLARAREAAAYIRSKYPGKRVLVVTHGGFIRALRTVIENRSYRETLEADYAKNCEEVQIELHPPLRRIPEVLDCWFESGSMPYAQSHFPYEATSGKVPPGFPADFIAEGVDQTRLWFYTLHVLGTILFDDAPYKNVVVNGIVLAEDGKKMSKRLKNYPDPMEVVERHGADALRFALMSSPAVRAEDLRFSEKTVEEALRAVILPLWNAYGFFVTYANAAKFEPVATRTSSPHPLDRAMRAQMQDLINRMTEQLEAYDLSATCAELHDTIDMLTNWYIRLSRRRFAGKGAYDAAEADVKDHEQDQQHALTTLYDVLITLSQVLAPFCPFVTDAIYLNLVPTQHGSIHLTDWPQTRALGKDEEAILKKTRMLRTIVSLGMKIRAEQRIKVRQPLAKATVAVPPALRKGLALTEQDTSLLRQELNVKELAFTDDPGALGDKIAFVNARAVGPRLGARVQELIAAGKRGEFSETRDGIVIQEEFFTPEEASIVYRGREGEGVAAEGGIVASLDTRVSPQLQAEGAMRDLVRAVQKLRKDAGFSVTDRITLQIDGLDDLVHSHGDQIAQETNAVLGKASGTAHDIELEGKKVSVRFTKNA